MTTSDETSLAVAANFIVADFLSVRAGEQFLVTADTMTDNKAVAALLNAARVHRASAAVMIIPQLPFQGGLADPYVPETLGKSVQSCDVWVDLTFPYLAGSKVFDDAVKTKRVRGLMCQDLGGGGIARLFAGADFDRLFRLQLALDALINESTGKECRITNPSGTDVSFIIGRQATKKTRRIDSPGMSTPPGSAVIYPEPASVRGTVVARAAFHEYYTFFESELHIEVDGLIRRISGAGSELRAMDRALRRARDGEYGSIIHFTHGFHPAARFHNGSFMESIRVVGNDAVGLGVPWWEPGGGENHPDAVITRQSVWIDNKQVVRDGSLALPDLAQMEAELNAG